MKHYAYDSPFNMVDKEGNKYKLTVHQDYDDMSDPLEYEDIVEVYCWHRNYRLGITHHWEDPEDFKDYIENEVGMDNVCMLPLTLYDHSGLSISTSTEWPYNCRWDSMRVGYAMIRKETALKDIWGATEENWRKKSIEYINHIIQRYDMWIRGDCWWYTLEKQVTVDIRCPHCNEVIKTETQWDELEVCGGFLGSDLEDNGIMESLSCYDLTFEEE